MISFFDDQMIILGMSNLKDVAGCLGKIIIGSNPAVACLKKQNYFSVNFRMSILEDAVQPTSMPHDEMCISLTLDEAEIFCETLYNLAKRTSETKEPVEIAFSGDNNSEAFAPKTFVQRSEVGWRCSHVAMIIKIEPQVSEKAVAKVTLETRAEDQFFCSAVLSSQDALLLSYIIRCSYMYAFHRKMGSDKRTRWAGSQDHNE
jgi:hypothetical protein